MSSDTGVGTLCPGCSFATASSLHLSPASPPPLPTAITTTTTTASSSISIHYYRPPTAPPLLFLLPDLTCPHLSSRSPLHIFTSADFILLHSLISNPRASRSPHPSGFFLASARNFNHSKIITTSLTPKPHRRLSTRWPVSPPGDLHSSSADLPARVLAAPPPSFPRCLRLRFVHRSSPPPMRLEA